MPKGRVLIAVSSVGLGHAARARVYGQLLERLGFAVEYYAPEPAGSYIEAWGGKVLPISREVESLSVYLERHWLETGSGLIGLRAALEEHRAALEAGRRLLEAVDLGSYDLVVAEEAWEIMSVAERIATPKAWIADFVGYRPVGLRGALAAWAVNRFLLRRYRLFSSRLYVGLPTRDLSWRMKPLGPRAVEVLKLFENVGPVPAFLPGELVERDEARRKLGLPPDAKVVLIQLGGTRAGEDIVERVARAAASEGLLPAVARGPRARARVPHGALDLGYQPQLPALLRAFDCAYTLAGLSTVASLAAAGIPAVLRPLPRHFEQEENARIAPRLWPDVFARAGEDPGSDVRRVCSKRPSSGHEALHRNAARVAQLLASIARSL